MKTMLALALIGVALAADQHVPVGAFSRGELSGWEEQAFKGATQYRFVERNGRRGLEARSEASASGLYKKVRIDLAQTPYLHWTWHIERTLASLPETKREGDDYVARVYVVISGGLFFWRTRAVNYVWAGTQPEGATWPNAYTFNARMLAVRSGDRLAGRWVSEQRNVRDDFKQFFGQDIRYIDAVAIMTDTDDSGGRATAIYGDIYFSASR